MSLGVLLLSSWIFLRWLDYKSCACGWSEDPIDLQRLAVHNPFRDSAADRAATQFLSAMRDGKCISVAHEPINCDKEAEYPITSWYLTGVQHVHDDYVYRFVVKRGTGGFPDPFEIIVSPVGKNWKETYAEAELY